MTDPYLDPSWVVESHPFARYRSDGDWGDGVRPAHIVENAEDVLWALGHAETKRPALACGFCGDRYQHEAKTPDTALHWFRTHECAAEGEEWPAA